MPRDNPPWQPPPAPAPDHLYAALPELPKLLVHLAARRVGSLTQTPEAIYAYLFDGDISAPVGRIPRLRAAAERLALAVQRREPVGIHGDYDADGVSATALLATWLGGLGLQVRTVLPRRDRDGYGLGIPALEGLAAAGCRLVVALDCGIAAVGPAQRARELGLELIVLDHHQPGEALPEGALLVDPRLPDGHPDDACLAAVGLAYRLAEAMVACGAGQAGALRELLDLVALGTIADVCPLTGQNRRLVAAGLSVLRQGKRPGLVALARQAGLPLERLDAEGVAFGLAPRLNAAGRLDDPRLAFAGLTTPDPARAEALAAELDGLNRQRRALTERALGEAVTMLGAVNGVPKLLFAWSAGWHPGVIGLVAGKLKERYQRPVVALTLTQTADGDRYTGSARSMEGFDLAAALHSCADLLHAGGGHARAAGLSVDGAAFEALRDRLTRLAEEQIGPEGLRPRPAPEALVQPERLTPEVVAALELLGPFGEGNSRPLLQADGLRVHQRRLVGANGAHAQLRLRSGLGEHRAVQFGADVASLPVTGDLVDALFSPRLDEYRGSVRVELHLAALRPAVAPTGRGTRDAAAGP